MLFSKRLRRKSASAGDASRRYRAYTRRDIGRLPQLQALSVQERTAMEAVAAVLPFRVNDYIVDELIDWSAVPEDPIFQLTFPQPEMLTPQQLARMYRLIRRGASEREVRAAAREIQYSLNPHPAGQMELNVPLLDGAPIPGIQHKYRETVLLFPAAGQTCHAYCTYCFRWPQFVGMEDLKFASREGDRWQRYLQAHREVRSVLLTGGDPMVMKASVLRRYVEPLLEPGLRHIAAIRIGTKSPAYWPYRFVSDPDADDILLLFEEVRRSGRHITVVAHYSHPRELETSIAQEAIRRIQDTGAVIRAQAPLVRHVNDAPDIWARLWQRQVRLGVVPYYMFVERDTGPCGYFEIPLARALQIFNDAYRQVSGLGRTVRGPSMSATPGKVLLAGVASLGGQKVFVLKFLQARDPSWVGRPFFARFDARATWLDDLRPAVGERFFYEAGLEKMIAERPASRSAGVEEAFMA
ncbi:MAG: lysine 2,3-aminomutase [Gemmatimonas sp. SM23_52]|nr:MAG: lysine 2,3-aminomutase [Gemmatimonas sp. SM23_52]